MFSIFLLMFECFCLHSVKSCSNAYYAHASYCRSECHEASANSLCASSNVVQFHIHTVCMRCFIVTKGHQAEDLDKLRHTKRLFCLWISDMPTKICISHWCWRGVWKRYEQSDSFLCLAFLCFPIVFLNMLSCGFKRFESLKNEYFEELQYNTVYGHVEWIFVPFTFT